MVGRAERVWGGARRGWLWRTAGWVGLTTGWGGAKSGVKVGLRGFRILTSRFFLIPLCVTYLPELLLRKPERIKTLTSNRHVLAVVDDCNTPRRDGEMTGRERDESRRYSASTRTDRKLISGDFLCDLVVLAGARR